MRSEWLLTDDDTMPVHLEHPPEDCWLHPSAEVRSSPIHGSGLFARTPIDEGTVVSRVGGRLVSTSELHDVIAAAQETGSYVDSIVVAEGLHLLLPPDNLNHFGNHSCDPNLWWIDAYSLATRRPVPANEELSNDYATSTGDEAFSMTCRCKTERCRGVVTGRDWSRKDLQRRYGDHWLPVY